MNEIREIIVRGILDLIHLSEQEPDYALINEIINEKKEKETE